MSTLESLSHHRWTLPVLAEIGRTGGGRFATLTSRLGVTGESLRRTLTFLQLEGLLEQNPGHGHPLRPEYVLSRRGRALAQDAIALVAALSGHEGIGLKKWSLPVLAQLGTPRRFSELQARLPNATPRALTLTLKDLQGEVLIERTVTDEYPPSVRYAATPAARPLVRAAARLATPGRRPRP